MLLYNISYNLGNVVTILYNKIDDNNENLYFTCKIESSTQKYKIENDIILFEFRSFYKHLSKTIFPSSNIVKVTLLDLEKKFESYNSS